jgi:MoxR-like ATPase
LEVLSFQKGEKMKYIKTDQGAIVTETKKALLNLAHARAFLVDNPPSGATELDPVQVGSKVADLSKEISSQLVGMAEATRLLGLGLLSGGNVFLWSLPGAGKSTIARLLAAGIDGKFFSINLGPGTGDNDLFGPPSISALKQDKWDIALARVAGSEIVLFDEWDKSSSVVHDKLLTVMEEKTIATTDGNKKLPLLLGIAAANDIPNPNIQNAVWDRLLFRMEVKYPGDYLALLDVKGGRKPVLPRLSPEDIQLIQGWVDYQALDLPREIREKMGEIYAEMKRKGMEVSPRRFSRWAKAIVAESLINGRTTPEMSDLYTGAYVLWVDLKDMDEVHKIVGATSDPEKSILVQAEAAIENVNQELSKLSGDTPEVHRIILDFQKGLNKCRVGLEGIRNGGNVDKKDQLIKQIQELNSTLLDKATEITSAS